MYPVFSQTLEKEGQEKDAVLDQMTEALRGLQDRPRAEPQRRGEAGGGVPSYIDESLRAERDIYLNLNKAASLTPRYGRT